MCPKVYLHPDTYASFIKQLTICTYTHRASSIWKHDNRKFGPQNALDISSDAAWKSAPSEESDPLAHYEIYFNRPVIVHKMNIQFQGGFVGMDCIVHRKKHNTNTTSDNNEDDWEEFEELYLDTTDTTDVQTFPVDDDTNEQPCTALRIDFGRSNDFYGRIIIYSLEVWGLEV